MENSINYQIFFSTSYQEKTLSTENLPEYFENRISNVSFPPGEYRVAAGKIARIVQGIPFDISNTNQNNSADGK